VFDETNGNNFDSSDAPSQVCSPDGVIPQVTVTVNGVPATYSDTGQILNTGGVDIGGCPPAGNESEQWVSIGANPCPAGAVLGLTPPTQTDAVGTSATVTASFTSCGTPLTGATVDFSVVGGPDAGLTGTATVDSSGNADFVYSGALTGTDTVQASVSNAAGTIASNDVSVVWTAASTSLSTTPPPSVPVGGTIGADHATLSGGVNPTGAITFALFGPADPLCTQPLAVRFAMVTGNGIYSSGPVGVVTVPGTYRWEVTYSGDGNNQSSASPCGAEQTVVAPQVLTGQAFGLSLNGLVHLAPQPNTGPVATTASTTVAPPCIVDLNATVVKAKAVCAGVTTSAPFPSKSVAQASTASAVVAVPGIPLITIGAVQSASATSCAGSAGSTTIASLSIGRTVIALSSQIKPNTTIDVGILKIVLNQQIPITGAEKGLTVNAIHITALNNAINLIVASASSDIGNCP
jgi:hypothetical protein